MFFKKKLQEQEKRIEKLEKSDKRKTEWCEAQEGVNKKTIILFKNQNEINEKISKQFDTIDVGDRATRRQSICAVVCSAVAIAINIINLILILSK